MLGAYPLWIDGFDTSIFFTLIQMSLLKKLKKLLVKIPQDQASFLVTEHCTKNLLNVPRDLVYGVMQEIDPEGLESRAVGIKNKKKEAVFHY